MFKLTVNDTHDLSAFPDGAPVSILVRDDGEQYIDERNMYRTVGLGSPFVALVAGNVKDGKFVPGMGVPLNDETLGDTVTSLGLDVGDHVQVGPSSVGTGSNDATYRGSDSLVATFQPKDGDSFSIPLSEKKRFLVSEYGR